MGKDRGLPRMPSRPYKTQNHHRETIRLLLPVQVGVDKDRVLLRMPATWAAIQAAKQLEADGIACHLVLVYRCPRVLL